MPFRFETGKNLVIFIWTSYMQDPMPNNIQYLIQFRRVRQFNDEGWCIVYIVHTYAHQKKNAIRCTIAQFRLVSISIGS